jgi:hypothetical protein
MIAQAAVTVHPLSTRLPRLIHQAPGSRAVRLHFLPLGLLIVGLLAFSPFSHSLAQTALPSGPASAPVTGKPSLIPQPVKPVISRPTWAELTPMQQQALKPLASSWNTINDGQKRKWLEISKNYPSLPPEGQSTMHSRMNDWVMLSPQQRAQARLNFGKTKELSGQLTPEEKKAKWETYQALSAEEKQKLAAKASPKPTGAATAVKPVAPQKLADVPPHVNKPGSRPAPKIMPSPPAAAGTPSTTPPGEAANSRPGTAPQR